ncbi:hypothetical protein CRYO30217_00320 [Parvicella tangerina]|uniref:Uncharacterized protein n=1 Tax=Parvicella tangerina TaxID=2829795 RepID=A0A916JJN4_9FLAO|nr:hypothetical protein CRYO30217_00320 [Parvicella tangerina]
MPLKGIISFILLIFINLFLIAQPQDFTLILRKVPKGNRFLYQANDHIMFQYHDSIHSDTIIHISSESVRLKSNKQYQLNEITTIYRTDGRSFFINGSTKFPIAGVIFLTLTTINQALSNGKPLVIREHLIPSLALGFIGIVMIPFRIKRYHLNKRWELITVPS